MPLTRIASHVSHRFYTCGSHWAVAWSKNLIRREFYKVTRGRGSSDRGSWPGTWYVNLMIKRYHFLRTLAFIATGLLAISFFRLDAALSAGDITATSLPAAATMGLAILNSALWTAAWQTRRRKRPARRTVRHAAQYEAQQMRRAA